MQRFALLLSLLLAFVNVPAAELPPDFTARYVVKKGPMQLGVASRQLQRGEDGSLVYRTSSDTTGLADMLFSNHVRETTSLAVVDGHALPLEYDYSRSGKRDRSLQQSFDWDAGRVANRLNNVLTEYDIEAPTYDLSGYQLNLMTGLARGTRSFDFNIAGKHGPRTYAIRHVGDETVNTALGEFDTVVVQRQAGQTTTLWCAAALNYLPVKIEHEENGSTFTAYLESVVGLGVQAAATESTGSE